MLSKYSSISPNFDTGAMAKISDGYTVGPIIKCIEEVLTCKRNLQLKIHPLAHVELINTLRFGHVIYIFAIGNNACQYEFSAFEIQFTGKKRKYSTSGGLRHRWVAKSKG